MASFDWKKSIEDSLKDGLIITIGAAKVKGDKRKTTKGIP